MHGPRQSNRFSIVAAMSKDTRAIGYQNKLPWSERLSVDMAFFRFITTAPWRVSTGDNNRFLDLPVHDQDGQRTHTNAVIMGRNTAESLDGVLPLSNRLNAVLSRTLFPQEKG